MKEIKEIRQGLIDARNILVEGGKLSQDQFLILEKLIYHNHYGIRRQALNLLFIFSVNHRILLSSGTIHPLSLYN